MGLQAISTRKRGVFACKYAERLKKNVMFPASFQLRGVNPGRCPKGRTDQKLKLVDLGLEAG